MTGRGGVDGAAASLARALVRERGETPQDAAAIARGILAYEVACHAVARAQSARRAGRAAPADALEA